MKAKDLYNLIQFLLFIIFLILGIGRLFYNNPSVVYYVSIFSFALSIIMVLLAASNEISSCRDIYSKRRENISSVINLIICIISVILTLFIVLSVILNQTLTKVGDCLSIVGFGISISSNYLASRICIFIQSMKNITVVKSGEKVN